MVSTDLEIAVETVHYFFWLYFGLNLIAGAVLIGMNHLQPRLVQGVVYGISLIDGIFLSALTVVTEGFDSILYWLFLGLIVRGAVKCAPGHVADSAEPDADQLLRAGGGGERVGGRARWMRRRAFPCGCPGR